MLSLHSNGNDPSHTLIIDEIIDIEQIDNHEISSYILKPQHIVNLILLLKTEGEPTNIQLTASQIGILFPKISKYREGLWIIEPSFIDPHWNNPVSVHVCNLSRESIVLSRDDEMLELIIFEEKGANFNKKEFPNKQEYKSERRKESVIFPKTFFDIKENSEKIAELSGKIFIRNASYFFGIIAVLFTAVTMFQTYFTFKYLNDNNYLFESIKDNPELKKYLDEKIANELSRLSSKQPNQ